MLLWTSISSYVKTSGLNWCFHLLTFELGNHFLLPQDLRKIMGETERQG